MTVRSTQLAAYKSTANVQATLYTVPAGWRAIVKSANVYNGSGNPASVTLWVQSHTNANRGILVIQSLQNNTTVTWQGWTVANPGDFVDAYVDQGSVEIMLSGTLLKLTGLEPA